MKRLLWAAAAVVLLSNGVAVFSALSNQWGQPESIVELTERDVWLRTSGEDNSQVSLAVRWASLSVQPLGRDQMALLGFDPKDAAASRALPRPGYVALESATAPNGGLTAIDAATDAATLRVRHPDRSRTLILRAVFTAYTASGGAVRNLLPAEIAVPARFHSLLQGLSYNADFTKTPPRYAVRIAAGRNYQPYVVEVRRLAPPAISVPK